MHLHGHNPYILHEGPGPWDGTIVRPSNPQRRDVQIVRGGGHLVLQFDATPGTFPRHISRYFKADRVSFTGAWGFHCHIAWHASGGFFSSFLVQPDEVLKMQIPDKTQQSCAEWDAWTHRNVAEQIDSGT